MALTQRIIKKPSFTWFKPQYTYQTKFSPHVLTNFKSTIHQTNRVYHLIHDKSIYWLYYELRLEPFNGIEHIGPVHLPQFSLAAASSNFQLACRSREK